MATKKPVPMNAKAAESLQAINISVVAFMSCSLFFQLCAMRNARLRTVTVQKCMRQTREACFHGTTGGEQVSPMKNSAFYFLSACICNFICSSHATPRQQPRYMTIQNQTFASK